MNPKLPLFILLPAALILFSLLFFSRGILIFLTALCLMVTQSNINEIRAVTLYLRWVFFFLLGLHALGDIFLGRTVRRIVHFDILAIFFVIYAFLSASYSPFSSLTLERAATVLALYITVFWIIWKYTYEQGQEKVVNLLLNVTLLIFAVSHLLIFIDPHRVFVYGRFQGIFQNPNSIGITAALMLPLSFWRFTEGRKKPVLFFLILSGLLLSASRNSINAALISMAYIFYARSKRYRPLLFLLSVSVILFILWAIGIWAAQFFHSYLRTESIPTIGGRINIWPRALELIISKPLFGYGFGVEDKIFLSESILPQYRLMSYVHNSYLGILLQLGLLGLIMLFAPLFALLFREFLPEQNINTPPLRQALRASLLAGLLSCIFESWVYSVGNAQAFPFWIIVMLLLFYRHKDKEENIPETT